MSSRGTLTLIEQAVMLLVLIIASALCLRAFFWSDTQSRRTADTDAAILQAQSAAETLKSCGGDYGKAAEILGGTWENGTLSVHVCDSFSVIITPADSGYKNLGMAEIEAVSNSDNSVLCSFPVSWQEVNGDG